MTVPKKQTKTCPHCSKPVTVWSLPSGYIEIEKSKTIDTSICNSCDDYVAADKKMKCSKSPYEDGLCHG